MTSQYQTQAPGSQAISTGKHNDEIHELEQVIEKSHEVLVTANTVFPFELFTDTVTLDRNKLTITKRNFFMSSQTTSTRIEDVLNVEVTIGPLLGSVRIASRVFNNEKPIKVNHLWREDAIRIKHVVQGYVIAKQKEIDCADLPKNELVQMLAKLGHE